MAGCAGAVPPPVESESAQVDRAPSTDRAAESRGKLFAQHLGKVDCRDQLREQRVRVSLAPDVDDPAVRDPMWLAELPSAVSVRHHGDSELHELMDCRLVLAVAQWTDLLRRHGVREVQHLSVYRPGARIRGSGRPSGHASGLAMDVFSFVLVSGRELRIEESWLDRRRGVDPCTARESGTAGEAEPEEEGSASDQALVRRFVCEAVSAQLFQVVLTPHHDAAHRNHVHMEVRPEADWLYLR